MRISIRVVLTAAFGSIAVAAAATLMLVLDRGRQNTTELVRERTELVLGQVTERLRLHLDPATAQAVFLADLATKGDLDPWDEEPLVVRLSAALAATPQVAALAVIRPDHVQIRVERLGGGTVSRRIDMRDVPGVAEALASASKLDQPTWRELVWSPQLGQPLANLRTPLRHDGQLVGEMYTIVTIAELSRFLSEWFAANPVSYTHLTLPTKRIV